MAVNGMPLIKFNLAAIDPVNPSHFVGGGADYTGFDFQDPTGNTGISDMNPPSSGLECHALGFDPNDGRLYFGQNKKYATDTNGGIWFSTDGPPYRWGTEMGFAAARVGAGHAPMGMFAGRDAGNNRFVVVVANTVGLFRWTDAGGNATWSACTENDTAPLPGTGGTLARRVPTVPFAQGTAPGHIYLWDQPNGLYRSTDYGLTWTQIWTQTNGNQLAVNPSVAGELWAAGTSDLYKITGAGGGVIGQPGGPVATGMGGVFSAGCAGVAFASNGAIFAVAQPGSGSAPSVTTLYVSYNDGASWTAVCQGDGSDASYGAPAGLLYLSPSNIMWSLAGTHVGWWNQVLSASGTASLSGQGTMTAVSSGQRGTAALSGQGTMTANGNTLQSASLSGHGSLTANATLSNTVSGIAALSGLGQMMALPSLITSVSVVPPYLPEQLITIADANDWFTWDIAYKTRATPRVSTTALSPDPDLALAVQAGASYEVRAVIFFNGPSGAGLTYNWTYPSDATMVMTSWRWKNGVLSPFTAAGNTNINPDTFAGVSGQEVAVAYGNFQSGVADGTLSFQWAQNNSNNTALNVLAYSFMMLRRIS